MTIMKNEIVFGTITFLANIIWAMTGFGNTIVFLLFFQIVSFTSIIDDFEIKYALLIQTISLIGPTLYLGFRIDLKDTFDKFLVIPLSLMTLVFTPLGTWLQTYVNEIYMYITLEVTLLGMGIGLLLKCKKIEVKQEKIAKHMVGVGIISGLLGGLIGTRGPPVLAYFLFYKYDKDSQRTCGYLTSVITVVSRIIIYMTTAPPQPWRKDEDDIWVIWDDWSIYVTVACCSLVGAVIGDYYRNGNTKALYIFLLSSTFLSVLVKILTHYF